jgi:hypothetical protein
MTVSRAAVAIAAFLALSPMAAPDVAWAEDAQSRLPLAPHGTKFLFEVIESHDAVYLGDTPGHMGRDGGLKVRPNVALGDGVYRTDGETTARMGTITRAVWDRVSGGLTVEFDPEPLRRIAVGDEVWVDLNPAPATARSNTMP